MEKFFIINKMFESVMIINLSDLDHIDSRPEDIFCLTVDLKGIETPYIEKRENMLRFQSYWEPVSEKERELIAQKIEKIDLSSLFEELSKKKIT